jgi:hypothetical protein
LANAEADKEGLHRRVSRLRAAGSTSDVVLWRFVQAFGGSVVPTVVQAMVRDLYDRKQSARILSLNMLVTDAAPIAAALRFGVNMLGMMTSTFINSRIVVRRGGDCVLHIACLIGAAGSLVLLATGVSGVPIDAGVWCAAAGAAASAMAGGRSAAFRSALPTGYERHSALRPMVPGLDVKALHDSSSPGKEESTAARAQNRRSNLSGKD